MFRNRGDDVGTNFDVLAVGGNPWKSFGTWSKSF